jgi:DNA-binding transcriptional LysR family regulator
MEIRELRAFVAVVDEEGLSAAARRLHVSQSALSQTVRSLERQLGARLLERTHAGVTATEVGAVLVREARALIDQHDRAVTALARAIGNDDATAGSLRIGLPLEFPADLLPAAFTELGVTHPDTRVEVRHSSSAVQLEDVGAGGLDLALVRDRPSGQRFDAVLVVREAMGVLLATRSAEEIAEPCGVHLHRLAVLNWIGFPRSDTPAWYDQVSATLRTHGVTVEDHRQAAPPVTSEVKLAAVGSGKWFALASPGWSQPLQEGIVWHPLIGDPIVRRTWAVWAADSRRRDLAALVATLDLTNK